MGDIVSWTQPVGRNYAEGCYALKVSRAYTQIFINLEHRNPLSQYPEIIPIRINSIWTSLFVSTNTLNYLELWLAFRYLNTLKLENKIHNEFIVYLSHAITEFWRKR